MCSDIELTTTSYLRCTAETFKKAALSRLMQNRCGEMQEQVDGNTTVHPPDPLRIDVVKMENSLNYPLASSFNLQTSEMMQLEIAPWTGLTGSCYSFRHSCHQDAFPLFMPSCRCGSG